MPASDAPTQDLGSNLDQKNLIPNIGNLLVGYLAQALGRRMRKMKAKEAK